MYLLGYDIGSSSIKASLINATTGECVSSEFFPKKEMQIKSVKPGWAEQDPETWWENLKLATQAVITDSKVRSEEIKAIGISYQMHGLVLVDERLQVIRDAIIWCDSRAVPYGEKAFKEIGEEKCLSRLLNSPGNFTLAKLAWVKENEPENFKRIKYYMLPGDYIALRLTGKPCTTASGLSEGIAWISQRKLLPIFCLIILGLVLPLFLKLFQLLAIRDSSVQKLRMNLDLQQEQPLLIVPAINQTMPCR